MGHPDILERFLRYVAIDTQSSDQSESFPSTAKQVNLANRLKQELGDLGLTDVVVNQTYKNDGAHPIEALYIFPASTRAAVYGMKMTIRDRVIAAEIHEREQARQIYEAARQAGRSASLLEQQRPNVFQMNVANILPGDEIQVELKYTELLIPTDGIYEFVFPTVVGPRYSNQPAAEASSSEKWAQNPYFRQGESPTYDFDLKVNLAAGLPIQSLDKSPFNCASMGIVANAVAPRLNRKAS
jgi:Ca-activated chloride channel family protein